MRRTIAAIALVWAVIATAATMGGAVQGAPPATRTAAGSGVALTSVITGPVAEAWVARYNGPNNGHDEARALAVDSAGNIYVTGRTAGGGSGTTYDYATIKYSPDGTELWARRYNGPGNGDDRANALAVDSEGNVYVTGYSDGSGTGRDYATIKYSPDGSQLWVARYNGPGNSYDEAYALALDAMGNVYVTGASVGSGTLYDYATIKYSPDGSQLWVARYNGPGNGSDFAAALAVDGLGNAYVTGQSWGSNGISYDYATVKYAPDGSQSWVARYRELGDSDDRAFALAVDADGNVYVTGESYDSSTGYDYATVKYSTDGTELWVRRYNGAGNGTDRAYALALDSTRNAYVTGYSDRSGFYSPDYATIKYGPDGTRLWVARYNGPASEWDIGYGSAVDAAGNVYVTGRSDGSGTSSDYATVKYDASGTQLWIARYNGPFNSADEARALAVDPGGNVYVTGYSYGSVTGGDYATIKYRQLGPPGTATGHTNLQGRANGGGAVVAIGAYTTTTTSGAFTVSNVAIGTYTATASMHGYLYASRAGVVVSEGVTTTLPTVTLLGGDANHDDAIDIFDLVALGASFGETGGGGDINGDGAVNIFDLVLVGANFGRHAPTPWP